MRDRVTFLVVALSAGLAASPALAADPPPDLSCSTSAGYDVSTTGLQYVDCGSETCTRVTYTLNSSDADHVGTFVRTEAGVVTASGSYNQTSPCGGDSVFGIADDTICHETIVRFNNKSTKSDTFTLQVAGRRDAINTSIMVKKGKSLSSCSIAGFGLESTVSSACVSSCGDFDEDQTLLKTEILNFKGCAVRFDRNLASGEVVSAELLPQCVGSNDDLCSPASNCSPLIEADVAELELFLNGTALGDGTGQGKFGDGILATGSNTCTTRVIGGRVYTWGAPCP
jgi:hypothetical protein